MKISRFESNPSLLMSLHESWRDECNAEQLNIKIDASIYLQGLQDLIDSPGADLLVLKDGDEIVGYMGLRTFKSPLGDQLVAEEHYFYIIPDRRGVSGVRMIKAAQEWAKNKGCSHLILNASCLASSLCSRVCALYEKFDFRKFEKSYIKVL